MFESLTITALSATGGATAYPTVNSVMDKVEEKSSKKIGKGSRAAAAGLSTTAVSASTMVYDNIHYDKVLNNAYAVVESMTDEQLEEALIAIGELEAPVEIEMTDSKTI